MQREVQRPPLMPLDTFQFLRGVNSAIELCRENGCRAMAAVLLKRHPQVLAIRDDGVFTASYFLPTHYSPIDGEVRYRSPGPEISPSNSEWMVPRPVWEYTRSKNQRER